MTLIGSPVGAAAVPSAVLDPLAAVVGAAVDSLDALDAVDAVGDSAGAAVVGAVVACAVDSSANPRRHERRFGVDRG
jgi:hypothetical protein